MKRLLVALLALILLAPACTALPKASEPAPFDVSAPAANPVELSADGPTRDSDPETLVSDFLLACAAGVNDDFATARLFLSSASAQRWRPEQQVLIYDTASRPLITASSQADGRAEASISAVPVASLDATGVLSRADSSQIAQTLSLVKEEGQWRIDAPEDSFIISKASFLASYQRANLYFPATTGDALVADPRWLPSRRLAAHLVEGLVAGPSKPLEDAVSNAIPGGTSIPSPAVDIADRVATVRLEGSVPAEGPARDLLVWQIASTLEQTPSIAEVEVVVSDIELKDASPLEGPSYVLDTRLGMAPGVIGTVNASKLIALPLQSPPSEEARRPAVSPVDRSLLAWREGEDLVISSAGAAPVRIRVGDGGAASIDRFGWTWTLKDSSFAALSAQGEAVDVPGAEPAALYSRIAVSPDGARALLIGSERAGSALMLATITRDGQGRPTGLESITPVAGVGPNTRDASWAGEDSFVVLRHKSDEDGAGGVELAEVQLGGFVTASSAPEGAEEISAGSGTGNVCARTRDASILCRSGALWQEAPAGLVDIRYPG